MKKKTYPADILGWDFFVGCLPYFCQNYFSMETSKKSTGLYWILFFLSIIAAILVYIVGGGYSSMVLPFIVTFFALAMDLM